MNWMPWIVSLVVAALLQTTLWHALPDLPLVQVEPLFALALLAGLLVPAADARLAALLAGLAADLTSIGPMGVHALAYGITGLAITYVRDVINRHVWLGRLVITFLSALPAQVLVALHLRYVQGGSFALSELLGHGLATALGTSLFVALLTLLPRLAPRRGFRGRAAWSRR